MAGKQTKSKSSDLSSPAPSLGGALAGAVVTTAGMDAMYSLGSSMGHDMFGELATIGTLEQAPEDPVQAFREAALGNLWAWSMRPIAWLSWES